jgi:ribosomal protein S18 acetylase RimI-like enzyme
MQIRYSVLQQSDFAELAFVLSVSFSGGEPMAKTLGMRASDIEPIVGCFAAKAAAEQLTIVARTDAGKLVGALLAQDFATPPPAGLELTTHLFLPIGALLDGLDEEYRQGKNIEPGQYLHLFMLGVLPEWAGQGIGHHLVATALENGQKHGYRVAVTEATGCGSQHIFRTQGFNERIMRKYDSYEFEGKLIFRSIEGHTGTLLMDKDLT